MSDRRLWLRGAVVRDPRQVPVTLTGRVTARNGEQTYGNVAKIQKIVFTLKVNDSYYDVSAYGNVADICRNLKAGVVVEVESTDFYPDTYESKKTGETVATIRLVAETVSVVKAATTMPRVVAQGVV